MSPPIYFFLFTTYHDLKLNYLYPCSSAYSLSPLAKCQPQKGKNLSVSLVAATPTSQGLEVGISKCSLNESMYQPWDYKTVVCLEDLVVQ